MIEQATEICPCCGQPRPGKADKDNPTRQGDETREIDRRGVVLPRRTRIGGIIIPQ